MLTGEGKEERSTGWSVLLIMYSCSRLLFNYKIKRLALSCAFKLTLLIGLCTFETVWECCKVTDSGSVVDAKKYFHVQLKKVEYPLHFSVQSPFNTLQRLHNLSACFTFKDYCKLWQRYVIYWVVLFNAFGHLPGVKQQKGPCYCMFIHLNLWLL